MKRIITTFLAVGLIGAGFAGESFAQDDKNNKKERREVTAASSLYVISAKAGAVNYIAGKVAIDRIAGKSGYLVKGDTVEKSETIRTGAAGKAEILLNPGSYVRLAENAAFKFDSTALDDLRVSLTAGSAIFEVIADDEFKVVVNTPKSKFYLLKSSVYRVDALSDGSGKISVWKGKAAYGTGKTEVVKGGQTTALAGGQTTVQKFDRDNKSELELWSKDRAKEIARANAKLQQRALSRSLVSSFAQNPWGRSNRLGLWVYDPFASNYCFLPFGYGWSSPYGFGFSRSIWDYRLPNAIYNNVNPNWNNIRNQESQNNFPSPNMGNSGNPGVTSAPSMPRANPPSAAPIDSPRGMPRIIERKMEPISGSQTQRPIDQ